MTTDERKDAWASLQMISDAIEELFGPVASLESEEGSLHRGPEYHHRAEGIVEALMRVAAAPASPLSSPPEYAECYSGCTDPDCPYTHPMAPASPVVENWHKAEAARLIQVLGLGQAVDDRYMEDLEDKLANELLGLVAAIGRSFQ